MLQYLSVRVEDLKLGSDKEEERKRCRAKKEK